MPPQRKNALWVNAGTLVQPSPAVKYRGIFINDEDWGLQPWAAKTFEPEHGGIGPKTYAKIFELLLRLKANTLWPAMHAVTKPFNRFAENARLADAYAIVMGSSHAEPMLRNNVGEWTAPPETYNYLTNRDGVIKYWDERLATNLRHMFFAAQAIAPQMERLGGGCIINMGSIIWRLTHTGLPAYSTSKAGVTGLTRTMAREYGPSGIRVNTISPGAVWTERQIKLWYTPEFEQRMRA